jgi:hypothetical protein
MIYEVNSKLRFLSTCGEATSNTDVRQTKHTSGRYQSYKRAKTSNTTTKKTFKNNK